MNLDEKDSRIIALIKRDARITNRDLANATGMSASACLERVRRLEAAGVILGYRALVSPDANSGRVEGWADIRFEDPSPDAIARFVNLVQTTVAIVEAHRTAGQYDYALRFLSNDMSPWRTFQKQIEELDCKIHARFSVLVEPLK